MTIHVFPGLRPTPLITYLAALGLGRVVAEQVDSRARFGWRNGVFHLDADIDDVAEFLVHRYLPTPVFSPWNSGSGFGEKDKTPLQYLDVLATSTTDRLAGYRQTLGVIRQVLKKEQDVPDKWEKERLLQELRNRLPDEALRWLDASTVLTADKPVFPPLLGTGGNDGRLDFSTNVHQRLVNILPDLGAKPTRSRAWADDLLYGRSTEKLLSASVGQGDPAAAGTPGSSGFGSADAMVNPWAFVLMVEGAMLFAASTAKRLGDPNPRAAIPFTVESSSDGPNPGAANEEGRGELWAPLIEDVALPELKQLFEEARGSWDGAVARSAVAMYGAVHSYGVNRGIPAFVRFGFLKRNGLAFLAVPLDTVKVESRPEVVMARRPLRRASSFQRGQGSATAVAARRFNGAAVGFVRDPQWRTGVAMLRAQTELELTAMRSHGNREELGRSTAKLVSASVVVPVMQDLFAHSAEARVAAGIASARFLGLRGIQPIRQLLIGFSPGGERDQSRDVASVEGFASRPTADVLADLMVWLAQHPGEDSRKPRGWLPWVTHSRQVSWRDIHAWVGGYFDEAKFTEYLTAFLAVDWQERTKPSGAEGPRPLVRFVDPTLAILQALASGHLKLGDGTDAEIHGIRPEWAIQLRADRVADVHMAASGVANRTKLHRSVDERPLSLSTSPHRLATSGLGKRILAALAAPSTTRALRFSAPELTTNNLNEGEAP